MRKLRVTLLVMGALLLAVLGPQDVAQADDDRGPWRWFFRAQLNGFEETPSVSTAARGEFRARRTFDGTGFEYQLRFQDLQGSVTQAHIHFAQIGVAGGISVWLCGTATNPGPAGTPLCGGPQTSVVEGTIMPDDVVGPSGQGISAGEFEELLRAMRVGATYANVHSTMWGGGEIRGQIQGFRGRDGDRDDD
jgi:hypothetical protein